MSRLLLPDSARPETQQTTLSLSWGNDGGNVVLVVQCGPVMSQIMMPPALAIQLGEGLIGDANKVLDLQRAATEGRYVDDCEVSSRRANAGKLIQG